MSHLELMQAYTSIQSFGFSDSDKGTKAKTLFRDTTTKRKARKD